MTACIKCKARLANYWLKNGLCNGCRNPHLIVRGKTIMIQPVDAAFWRKKLSDLGHESKPYIKNKTEFSRFAQRYCGFVIKPKPNVTIESMHCRLADYIVDQINQSNKPFKDRQTLEQMF